MNKVLIIIGALIAIAYVGFCALLFFVQRSMLYLPTPIAPGAQPPSLALEVKGATLRVTTFVHPGRDAVIYFGGNGEEVDHALPTLEAAFPTHALYLMHYRGYSGSTGAPTESALFEDAVSLFDRVRAEHDSVVVIGRSLGSGVAIQLAARRPASRLVLVTPYDSIAGIAAGQFPFVPVSLLLRDKFESWRYAASVTAPTLLIVAAHDEVIPRTSSEALYSRFKAGVAAEAILPEATHNTVSQSEAYIPLLAGTVDSPPKSP